MFSIFTCFSKKYIATWKVRIAKILFSFEEIMKIKNLPEEEKFSHENIVQYDFIIYFDFSFKE